MAPEEIICIVFVTLAGLVAIALIPTTIVHMRRRNVPLTSLIISCLILDLFAFINALIWFRKDEQSWWYGQGLCDIEVKMYLGLGQSLLGATASIFKQLSSILDTRRVGAETSLWIDKRHSVFVAILCYIIPSLIMIFHYLVQPNRYQVDRFNGCRPTWDPSWLSVLLLWSWYPLVSAICFFYACLTTLRLLRHRREVGRILSISQSQISKTQFIRLYGLSSVLMCCLMPFAFYFFVNNTLAGWAGSYSWRTIHPAGWSKRIVINAASKAVALDRWVQILSGALVFLFFGTGREAASLLTRCAEKGGLTRVYHINAMLCRAAISRRKATFSNPGVPHSHPPLNVNVDRNLSTATYTIDDSITRQPEIELSILNMPNHMASR